MGKEEEIQSRQIWEPRDTAWSTRVVLLPEKQDSASEFPGCAEHLLKASWVIKA